MRSHAVRTVVTQAPRADRKNVLIFYASDFSREDGGMRYSKNALLSLSAIENVRFTVVTCNAPGVAATNAQFVNSLGFQHIFIERKTSPVPAQSMLTNASRPLALLLRVIREKYFFHYEIPPSVWRPVDAALMKILAEDKPDAVVVNGFQSALLVPSVFGSGLPCCLISHNNEIPYHRMIKSESLPLDSGRWLKMLNDTGNGWSEWRFRRRFESIVHRCAGVVVLTATDMPAGMRSDAARSVISPSLPKEERQWACRGARRILFVGTISVLKYVHFSNRRAVQWICTELAPVLQELDGTVLIDIIGANREEVPERWRQENIRFLGRGTRADVVERMTTTGLFIAPIDTNFGAKLKLAECISFGTPFIASDAAMSGLSYLQDVPKLVLEDPAASAALILKYLDSPEALCRLSETIGLQAYREVGAQDRAWRELLQKLLAPSSPRE